MRLVSCQRPGELPRPCWLDEKVTARDGFWEATLCACKCLCCESCWFFLDGPRKGTCVHGGPYAGYVEVPDRPVDTSS